MKGLQGRGFFGLLQAGCEDSTTWSAPGYDYATCSWFASDAEVQQYCAGALLKLAASEQHRGPVAAAGGIDAVVAAMRSHGGDAAVQQYCAGALWNLALSEQHRGPVAAAGGIDALVAAMGSHGGDAAVQQNCAGALELL